MIDKNREIGVIVTYPEKNKKHTNFSGIAGYTKNLLLGIGSNELKKFVVFSNIKKGGVIFEDSKVEVNECWHRGSLFFVNEIVREIKKYPKLKTIHLQHEFNLFGGPLSIFLYLLLLKKIKALDIKVIVTYHGVVSQKSINKQFSIINQLVLPTIITKILFKFVFSYSSKFIDKVIVHEEYFKSILVNEYSYRKSNVNVISHGVEDFKTQCTQKEARVKLGIRLEKKVILFFGFLAGYKGLDLLIDAFKKLDANEYALIIAGGKSSRVENDKKYLKWYQSLVNKIKGTPNIIRVDFVPDEQVHLYYKAADVLILPYLIMLSASGPMAFSLGYNKPFLASDAFNEVLSPKIIFKRDPKQLSQKLTEFFDDKKSFQIVVEKMREKRLWDKIGQKTFKFILK